MTIIQDFLQVILVICLFLLPAVLLTALLRLPPIYRLMQRDHSLRTRLALAIGLLCFGIYFLALTWLVADGTYSIAKFYFDSTFGMTPGVTLAQLEQSKWDIINELWLRGLFLIGGGQRCFSGTLTICQLADEASKISSPQSFSLVLLAMSLFSAFLAFLLGLRFTRHLQS